MAPTLLSLNLSNNQKWWENDVCFSLLLQVIQKQKNLKDFDLSGNKFTAEQTKILLKTITESEMFHSL